MDKRYFDELSVIQKAEVTCMAKEVLENMVKSGFTFMQMNALIERVTHDIFQLRAFNGYDCMPSQQCTDPAQQTAFNG